MASVFDDVRLPVDVEVGAQGGPMFSTTILGLGSGVEIRNQDWRYPKHKFDIGYGIQTLDSLQAVRSFFYNRRGRARAFRFKDWSDFHAQDTIIPTNGATGSVSIALTKTYVDSAGNQYSRFITRVRFDTTPTFKVNGSPIGFGTITNGLVSFGSLPPGVLTGTFDFDIPVRFDTDEFTLSIETIQAGFVQSLPIIEVIENAYTLSGQSIP